MTPRSDKGRGAISSGGSTDHASGHLWARYLVDVTNVCDGYHISTVAPRPTPKSSSTSGRSVIEGILIQGDGMVTTVIPAVFKLSGRCREGLVSY